MPKTKAQKETTVQELARALEVSQSAVIVDYKGLNAKETAELRRTSRNEQVPYAVVKKTLLKLAVGQAGVAGLEVENLQGNIAIAFGAADAVSPAKFLVQFGRAHEAMKILGGILEKKFVDAAQVKALAALPSRDELIARVVGTIAAPLSGFVNVLAGNLRSLVYVLSAVQKRKATA